jgi:hypothetical protein
MAKKTERMLVCNALDERDFLRKKIISAINSTYFIACKRVKDDKVRTTGFTDPKTFENEAKSAYQSITDMIDRYTRLDTAITLANASTEIKLSDDTVMTRAAAISMRKALVGDTSTDFTGKLINVLERQFASVSATANELNAKADRELEQYKDNMTSGDKAKELTPAVTQTLESLVADNRADIIDPIGVEKEIKKLEDKYETLKKELDSAIKVSNATTFVEF